MTAGYNINSNYSLLNLIFATSHFRVTWLTVKWTAIGRQRILCVWRQLLFTAPRIKRSESKVKPYFTTEVLFAQPSQR